MYFALVASLGFNVYYMFKMSAGRVGQVMTRVGNIPNNEVQFELFEVSAVGQSKMLYGCLELRAVEKTMAYLGTTYSADYTYFTEQGWVTMLVDPVPVTFAGLRYINQRIE
ncbi:MAG: hypothetical protein HYV13_03130 [Candidatus Doudnabacteria bacterium]|nr:hypothetical protein [Candidatus Doudnabacteria bacterium]